jgi:hypothetical protein
VIYDQKMNVEDEGKRIDSLSIQGYSKTIGAETFKVLLNDADGMILLATGLTVPTDGGAGFAKGCIFIDTNVGAGTTGQYINIGSITAANFDVSGTVTAGSVVEASLGDNAVTLAKMYDLAQGSLIVGGAADAPTALSAKGDTKILVGDGTDLNSVTVTGDVTISNAGVTTIGAGTVHSSMLDSMVLQVAEVNISKAQILDAGAGGLSHAAGFPLVATPGAQSILVLDSAVLIYDYATAAYGGGGNLSICESAGGKALTGIETTTDAITAAHDEVVVFRPLSTEGVPVVKNTGFNLVSASAITDVGGTAAGVCRVKVSYRVFATGL